MSIHCYTVQFIAHCITFGVFFFVLLFRFDCNIAVVRIIGVQLLSYSVAAYFFLLFVVCVITKFIFSRNFWRILLGTADNVNKCAKCRVSCHCYTYTIQITYWCNVRNAGRSHTIVRLRKSIYVPCRVVRWSHYCCCLSRQMLAIYMFILYSFRKIS